MTAKEYLSQAWKIKTRLEAMKEQLDFLKSTTTNIASQPAGNPVSGTKNIHKTEDAIIRYIDYEERMKKQRAILDEINTAINNVSHPTAQVILVKRFLKNMSWDKISDELYISNSQVYRLYKEALDEIKKMKVNEWN